MKKLIFRIIDRLLGYVNDVKICDRALDANEKKELFFKEYKEFKKYN
jgi:hypothetical protein